LIYFHIFDFCITSAAIEKPDLSDAISMFLKKTLAQLKINEYNQVDLYSLFAIRKGYYEAKSQGSMGGKGRVAAGMGRKSPFS
jgi:hypothetical protein